MSQPKWRLIANLGDTTPLDYGALLVWVDDTGVYPPEMEYFDPEVGKGERIEVYRIVLEPCTFDVDGNLGWNELSDRTPLPLPSTWFAKHLDGVASACGRTRESLIEALNGEDVLERAWAYRDIASVEGWRNFDDYPLQLTRQELCRRYVWLHSALASLDQKVTAA